MAGQRRRRDLTRVVEVLAREWQLRHLGECFPGERVSFVAPVTGANDEPLVLKISEDAQSFESELAALRHWSGAGAVNVRAARAGEHALLIDRVVPGDSLVDVARVDDDRATAIGGELMATLASAGRRDSGGVPHIPVWLKSLRDVHGLPALSAACREASAVADRLMDPPGRWTILHGDLHHENVRRNATGQWVAIDPKGIFGPPEFEPAAFLRNPRELVLAHPDPRQLLHDRVTALSARLGYDPARVAQWGYVGAVLAAAWAIEDGDGIDEADRWLSVGRLLGPPHALTV